MPTVERAPGSIVLTETGSCAVREFDLPTGIELPNVVARSTCQLWAAPVTAKVAVGIGEPVGDAVPFRFLDLGRRGRDLGNVRGGVRVPDLERRRPARGLVQRPPRGHRPGARRPAAPARRLPGRLHAGRRDRLRAGRPARTSRIGPACRPRAGSRACTTVATARWRSWSRAADRALRRRAVRRTPSTSRSGSKAGCRCSRRTTARRPSAPATGSGSSTSAARATAASPSAGHVASWSPDGDWLAVGGADEITFYDLGPASR